MHIPPNTNNIEKPFTCPDCQGAIVRITCFRGWEELLIHSSTGDILDAADSGQDEIHSERWGCIKCPWSAEAKHE